MNGHTWLSVSATNGNLRRLARSGYPVVAQTATFQQVTGVNPVDTNSNSLYDRLDIDLSLNVVTGGDYTVVGTLVDANDAVLATGYADTTLATGTQAVTLGFDGETLRNRGIDGPYVLTNLIIDYQDPSAFSPLTVDTATDVFTTTAYSHRQFEGDLVTLLDASETVTDTNGNGLYDQLTVKLDLDVIFPGQFDWMGMLEDQYGHPIARFDGSGYLDSQTPMTFTFAGREINKAALDGPFKLRGVAFNQTSGGNANVILGEVHTTAAYTAAQFEPPLACGGPVPSAVNADFEQRVIELVNIERANQGLPPMKRVGALMDAARYHANDMQVDNYLEHDSHDRINGALTFVCAWDERINTFYPTQWFLAENLAGSFASPESVMNGWMNSSGHRANILGGYREIGVGYAGNWVQDFHLDPFVYPLIINGEAATTASTAVTLYAYGEWDEIRLRNNGGTWSAWQPFTNTLSWSLDATIGLQTVEAEMRDSTDTIYSNDTIEYIGPPTPTPTQTPTPTPIPNNATTIYLTSNVNGTVGGVAYADEDLLAFDIATGDWSLFFDGSDVGVDGGANLNAFHLETDGTLLLSFEAALVLPELGTVNQQDIVRFTPSSLGATTAGSWSFYFDGSDVGLESANELVDAIGRHPDGRLLVSVGVNYTIGTLSGEDEDLLLFSATSLGDTTSGSWEIYLDGSDVGLANAESEDIWGLWSDPATGNLYLTTRGDYSVTGAGGDQDDIFICVPVTLGENSSCTFAPYWDGDSYGFGDAIYDFALATAPVVLPTPMPTPTPVATPVPLNMQTLYLSSDTSGTVGGVSYADEDIVAWDVVGDSWSLYFDGSDVGASAGDVNAFHLETDGSILLSFEGTTTLPNVGTIMRGDIVRFVPTSLGATTAGSYEFYFDGSDVGLESNDEIIDSISRHPDGSLLLSVGVAYDTGTIDGEDEDILRFTATSLGATTAGSWDVYLDGSDVGLATAEGEDIWGLWSDPATGNLYLSTRADHSVPGVSGDQDDIFICVPVTVGENSSCSFFPFWDGDAHGYTDPIYGITIVTGSSGSALREGQLSTDPAVDPTVVDVEQAILIYLPHIAAEHNAAAATDSADQAAPTAMEEDERIYLPLIR